MGPKRGKGAVKKSQRGTGRGQVAERSRSPTPADMGVEVAALKTFYKSNRTQMSCLKRTVGKSGEGAEKFEDLSATDKWAWEKFSFLKDHIESVEHRNVVSIRGTGMGGTGTGGRGTPATATATGPAVPPPTAVIIQSDSGPESQSIEPPLGRSPQIVLI